MENLRLGPVGGSGGKPFDDYTIPNDARLTAVHIYTEWVIDALRIDFVHVDGQADGRPPLGGLGGAHQVFYLEEDEYLTGISGRCGWYVDAIRFHTNKRVSDLYGGRGGERDYALHATPGFEIAGFFGRADWYVDALGAILRPLAVREEVSAGAALEAEADAEQLAAEEEEAFDAVAAAVAAEVAAEAEARRAAGAELRGAAALDLADDAAEMGGEPLAPEEAAALEAAVLQEIVAALEEEIDAEQQAELDEETFDMAVVQLSQSVGGTADIEALEADTALAAIAALEDMSPGDEETVDLAVETRLDIDPATGGAVATVTALASEVEELPAETETFRTPPEEWGKPQMGSEGATQTHMYTARDKSDTYGVLPEIYRPPAEGTSDAGVEPERASQAGDGVTVGGQSPRTETPADMAEAPTEEAGETWTELEDASQAIYATVAVRRELVSSPEELEALEDMAVAQAIATHRGEHQDADGAAEGAVDVSVYSQVAEQDAAGRAVATVMAVVADEGSHMEVLGDEPDETAVMVTDTIVDNDDLTALEDEAVEGAISALEEQTGRTIEDVEVTLYSGLTEDAATGQTVAAVVAIATAVAAPQATDEPSHPPIDFTPGNTATTVAAAPIPDEATYGARGPALTLGTSPREPRPKDLELVEGIGPRIAALLIEHNIYNLADLAVTPVERLRAILAAGGARFRLAEPSTWPEQAALGAAGDWAGLTALQTRLKGGR
ncbi:jacalin-like lectin [Promineifilum sp.]|uniref:jacalin-like lectin n=1 Tax=Promineifilum sp. TaxID=2664178 RepID=UPI0035AEF1EF